MAAGALAAAARRTLLLSGTISSGKASGSFYLLFRFVKAIRQEFRYSDYTRWVDRYGIWQRRWKPDPNDRVSAHNFRGQAATASAHGSTSRSTQ